MPKLTYRIAAASILLVAVPGQAKIVTATAANFLAAFKTVVAGDKIILSGTFAGVSILNRTFDSTITIDARGATFTKMVRVMKVNNVNWIGGKFLIPDTGVNYTKAITVSTASNIAFSALFVRGHDTGQGVQIGSGTNISVANSTFDSLRVGVSMAAVTGGTISNNRSVHASGDGFNVSDSHKVNVTNNSCSGSVPSTGAHADCIQLWSIAGHVPNSDILIADNVATGNTQGFTSFNGTAGGGDRISILRNRVDTIMPQGIACYGCRDSNISNNVVTTQSGAAHRTSINIVGGARNTVSGNTVGAKPVGKPATVANFDMSDFTDMTKNPLIDMDISTAGLDTSVEIKDGGLGIAGAVPEPQTWATMLTGFALAGAAMRRRRRTAVVDN